MARLTPEEFGAAFGELFRRSAFRLELLDRYTVPNEAEPLRRFRAGLPQDPAWREPWARFVRESVAAGKVMERVHVVSEPLTEYLKFEVTSAYPANAAAGEDIRVLPVAKYPVFYPVHDFWLFDDAVAAVMDYDDDGRFLGADVTRHPVRIKGYQTVAECTMLDATRLADYLASLGTGSPSER